MLKAFNLNHSIDVCKGVLDTFFFQNLNFPH